jgi:hypothetical protein
MGIITCSIVKLLALYKMCKRYTFIQVVNKISTVICSKASVAPVSQQKRFTITFTITVKVCYKCLGILRQQGNGGVVTCTCKPVVPFFLKVGHIEHADVKRKKSFSSHDNTVCVLCCFVFLQVDM